MTELTKEKTRPAGKLQHCIGDGTVGVPGGATAACWDCSICLETASEPVVTLCGHLYCWPCIFRWLTTSSKSKSRASPSARCPVCKAAVSEDHLVPLYGRARAATLSPAGGRGGRVCQVPRGPPVPGPGPDSDDGGNFYYYYDNVGVNGLDCFNAERLLGGIALAVLLPWAARGGGRPPPPSLYRDGEGWRMARQERRVARRLRQILIPRVDIADVLGGDIAAVESVVASPHEARMDYEDLISSETTNGGRDAEHSGLRRRLEDAMLDEEKTGSYNGASEVVAESNDMPPDDISDATVREDGDAEGVFVTNSKGSCWT